MKKRNFVPNRHPKRCTDCDAAAKARASERDAAARKNLDEIARAEAQRRAVLASKGGSP